MIIQTNMNINTKYKELKNLQELIRNSNIENSEFDEWIKNIPDNYRWWFNTFERYLLMNHPMMGQAFYPHGLIYNGEIILYLITHGFVIFYKQFFENYIKANPDNLPLKQILETRFNETWFLQDKNINDYRLSDELRVYLDDTNFQDISNFDQKGEELLKQCKKELKLIKSSLLRDAKNYYFIVEILSEITKIDNKKLSDSAKLLIGKIFSNDKYSIYDIGVSNRFFKELADDEFSELRTESAFLFAKTIDWKHGKKEATEALKYYQIATSETENASIFYMMGLICQKLEQTEEVKKYFSKAANLDYKIAIDKCKDLNISL